MMLDFYVITCYCISCTGSAHVIILFQWESFKISPCTWEYLLKSIIEKDVWDRFKWSLNLWFNQKWLLKCFFGNVFLRQHLRSCTRKQNTFKTHTNRVLPSIKVFAKKSTKSRRIRKEKIFCKISCEISWLPNSLPQPNVLEVQTNIPNRMDTLCRVLPLNAHCSSLYPINMDIY